VGHEAHLDHAGEISWYVGHGPAPILGPCPHTTCQHLGWSTVAWGPDLNHYELVVCDDGPTQNPDGGGCDGQCRGWVRQTEGSNARGQLHHLQRFDPTQEHHTTREERRAEDERRQAERDEARRAAAHAHWLASLGPLDPDARPVVDGPQA
jgi:hypothetical protein